MTTDMKMNRTEMLTALRVERLKATQRLLVLKRELKAIQGEVAGLERRLDHIEEAEQLLH